MRIELQGNRLAAKEAPGKLWASLLALPGADRKLTFPATPASAGNLHEVANGSASWCPEASELLNSWDKLQGLLGELRNYENADLEPLPHKGAFNPWKHQLAGYHTIMHAQGGLLYFGMGTGKTRIAFDVIRAREARRILVVCPKSVIDNWAEEAEKHAPGLRVVRLNKGSVAKRTEQARQVFKVAPEPVLFVLNYEGVWRPPFDSFALSSPWDLVIADEVHRVKSAGGKASRFMGRLGSRVPHRLGLSGTPCPHSLVDAYGVMRFIDPGVFGTSASRFKQRYTVLGGFENREIVDYQNVDEFNKRFYSVTLRVDRDVLDLPPAQHMHRYCELPPKARRVYQGIKQEFIADVDGGVITASNVLARLQKLQQIASGRVYNDDEVVAVHDEKKKLLADILLDLPDEEPVVVFCNFKHDFDQIHSAAHGLGRGSLELSGRRDELTQWKTGKAPILAAQIRSGGTGVDLTRASYAFYWSHTHSLGDYEQSLTRSHRPGQTRSVTFIHLLTQGTVDIQIFEALGKRKKILKELLKNPRIL